MAYEFVHESEYGQNRRECSEILQKTCALLKEKGISAVVTLIGSGGRNMVTRNGNGPYDLDYNLEIVKLDQDRIADLREMKELIRGAINQSLQGRGYADASSSTSCLTVKRFFSNMPIVEFSFDVGIVMRNRRGNYMRLVQNKNGFGLGLDQYTWEEIPSSGDVKEKSDKLKQEGHWPEVRDAYLDLKNLYLQRWDKDHKSFVVYIEAVNQVYAKYRGGKRQ